jgi:hypothetical protein
LEIDQGRGMTYPYNFWNVSRVGIAKVINLLIRQVVNW